MPIYFLYMLFIAEGFWSAPYRPEEDITITSTVSLLLVHQTQYLQCIIVLKTH